MIFQDPFASLTGATVRYHLTRALRIHGRAGDSNDDLQRPCRVCSSVQLTPSTLLEKYLARLSAANASGWPSLGPGRRSEALLADEPVSIAGRLHPTSGAQPVARPQGTLNLAILTSPRHCLGRYFADNTLVMYAGRLVEGGAARP